jgi:hypothetical protein
MGLWEMFNNPNFNSIEFDGIKIMSGLNSFALTPKRWIETTNAKGPSTQALSHQYPAGQPVCGGLLLRNAAFFPRPIIPDVAQQSTPA